MFCANVFGHYVLAVSKAGFSRTSQPVEISSAVPRSLKIILTIQPIQTSVEVKDSDTLLDTERTGVAYYTGSREIAERRIGAGERFANHEWLRAKLDCTLCLVTSAMAKAISDEFDLNVYVRPSFVGEVVCIASRP